MFLLMIFTNKKVTLFISKTKGRVQLKNIVVWAIRTRRGGGVKPIKIFFVFLKGWGPTTKNNVIF